MKHSTKGSDAVSLPGSIKSDEVQYTNEIQVEFICGHTWKCEGPPKIPMPMNMPAPLSGCIYMTDFENECPACLGAAQLLH